MTRNSIITLLSFLALSATCGAFAPSAGMKDLNANLALFSTEDDDVTSSDATHNGLPQTITTAEGEGEAVATLGKVDDEEIQLSPAELLRQKRKQELLSILGSGKAAKFDAVLACPTDKAALSIRAVSPILGTSTGKRGIKVLLETSDGSQSYRGRTDTFYDLLNAVEDGIGTDDDDSSADGAEASFNSEKVLSSILDAARVFVPPPLRSLLPNDKYIPMRDLFTSPAVSFAYERGWRQGFAAAGFPGVDSEYQLVKEYFDSATRTTSSSMSSVVVDMSCATGLMTRRLAQSGDYDRVIGCDYSESMLYEARNRINQAGLTTKAKLGRTQLDLVRLDVAQIPMQDDSVSALHAGAAMHCWPDVQTGLNEIYRVLKPGGRYFASTFLSEYFQGLQAVEREEITAQMQAFQYFESTDKLKEMLLNAGFEEDKITIDVLGSACAIMKCEK